MLSEQSVKGKRQVGGSGDRDSLLGVGSGKSGQEGKVETGCQVEAGSGRVLIESGGKAPGQVLAKHLESSVIPEGDHRRTQRVVGMDRNFLLAEAVSHFHRLSAHIDGVIEFIEHHVLARQGGQGPSQVRRLSLRCQKCDGFEHSLAGLGGIPDVHADITKPGQPYGQLGGVTDGSSMSQDDTAGCHGLILVVDPLAGSSPRLEERGSLVGWKQIGIFDCSPQQDRSFPGGAQRGALSRGPGSEVQHRNRVVSRQSVMGSASKVIVVRQ